MVSNGKGKLSVPKALETELYDLTEQTEKYMRLDEWWKVQFHAHNEYWVRF